MDTPENITPPTPRFRPLGAWLRTVDDLIRREFATAFESEGITRRDWRILNVLDGDAPAPGTTERLPHAGKRMRALAERGWVVVDTHGAWSLTAEGRAAKARLSEAVGGIRSRIAGAVSPEDFATTMASLQAIARELGGDGESPMPSGRRHRHRCDHGSHRSAGRTHGRRSCEGAAVAH
jgi:hypothetical protein